MVQRKKIKLLVFHDDNDAVKNKTVIINNKDDFGVEVQFYDINTRETYGSSFFLPWHRILKIKNIEEDDKD